MKISELNQKSFLGGAGAAQKSYVLINYEDDNTSKPVTYRASLDELGKAIANNLHLYKETANGAVTTSVNQGAYVDGTAKQLVTAAEKTKIANAASTGDVTAAVNGLASTGYVTSTVNGAKTAAGVVTLDGDKLKYYSSSNIPNYVTANMINGVASTGYVTNAINGLASTGYVTNAVANAGGGGFDPTESISCEFIPYGIEGSDPIEERLYPVMTDGYAFYHGTNNETLTYFAPLDKILFYDIYESDGGSRTLLLKDKNDYIIHSIPLN